MALSSFVDWLSPILLRTRLVSQAGFRMCSLGQAPCFNSPRKWGLVWKFYSILFIWHKIIRNKQTPRTSYFCLWQESMALLGGVSRIQLTTATSIRGGKSPRIHQIIRCVCPVGWFGISFFNFVVMIWSIFLWFSLVMSNIQNTYCLCTIYTLQKTCGNTKWYYLWELKNGYELYK